MSEDFNPTDLDAQEQRRNEANEKSRFAQTVALDDYKWLMGGKRGRRIVWRLLSSTGVYRQSYTGNGSETFFREGSRSVGLQIVEQLHAIEGGADLYALMRNEASSKNG
jgi:hypothetical protein